MGNPVTNQHFHKEVGGGYYGFEITGTNPQEVVLVDSPVGALSFHELFREPTVISTGKSASSELFAEIARRAITAGQRVLLAFEQDASSHASFLTAKYVLEHAQVRTSKVGMTC